VIGHGPRRQLTQGWAGALTDWAALGSLTADQAAKYQSAWIPNAALSEPVSDQGTLSWAAPTKLVALAATLSSMQVKAEQFKNIQCYFSILRFSLGRPKKWAQCTGTERPEQYCIALLKFTVSQPLCKQIFIKSASFFRSPISHWQQ